jgi:group I intron endonuclease
MNGIIYKATNKENGKVYIGQTIELLEKRKKRHKRDAEARKGFYFGKAIRKYGFDKFDWITICNIEAIEDILFAYLNIAEQTWISEFDSMNPEFGYNLTEGGLNGKRSNDTRKKISLAKKGVSWGKHTEESKKKMSKAMRGKYKGKSLSEEHKKKISKKRSEENKKKISLAKIGKKNPMYGIHRFGKDNPMYGKHHTEKTKKKISKSLKTRS